MGCGVRALTPMDGPRKALPEIDPERCTGFGWCIGVCPPHVLSLQVQSATGFDPKRPTLHDAPGGTDCALCAVRCPFDAIQMVKIKH